ncbi:hypothetical protein ACL02S_00850 [Nocardia sp. 004]|uniref:hypothetical protein n=1 Tax=Nocardia sp. 004 TaxID=3385978 RepID=UPI0039A1E551
MGQPDVSGADQAMRDIANRRDQVTAEAARQPMPWSYVLGSAAATWLVVAAADYENMILLMVAGLTALVLITAAAKSSQRVQPYRFGQAGPVRNAQATVALAALGVYLVAAIGLRSADVAHPHTIAGAAMVLLFVASTPWLRRVIRVSLTARPS